MYSSLSLCTTTTAEDYFIVVNIKTTTIIYIKFHDQEEEQRLAYESHIRSMYY